MKDLIKENKDKLKLMLLGFIVGFIIICCTTMMVATILKPQIWSNF